MKKILIIIAIMTTLSSSCSNKILESDSLHLPKKNYTGNQLRTDGYYYQFYDNIYFSAMFLYADGTVVAPGGSETSIEDMDSYIVNSFIKKQGYKKVKYWWGVFNIEEDYIAFEKWYPSEPPLITAINEGKILNDTTFIIKKRYRLNNGEETHIRETDYLYHFREFSQKPDSTNVFIP